MNDGITDKASSERGVVMMVDGIVALTLVKVEVEGSSGENGVDGAYTV